MKWYSLKNLFFIILFLQLYACKKEELINVDLEGKTFEFGIVGQLYPSIKDVSKQTVEVIIPQTLDKSKLTAFYSGTAQSSVLLNNLALTSNQTVADYSKSVQLSVISNQNQTASNWTVNVKYESEALGLGSEITAGKSLNTSYDYYIDQKSTGSYASVNCGPTVSTMASKWAVPNFSGTVADARKNIKTSGGGWSTSDVVNSLNASGANTLIIYLSNIQDKIKNCIDRNYQVILCLDMYYVNYNTNKNQQTDKFYATPHKQWGHFILVKGYRMVDGKMYLETYDPNSGGAINPLTKQPMGKDRYYLADQVKVATEDWWKYAIVVAPQGQKIDLCDKNTQPSTEVPVKQN